MSTHQKISDLPAFSAMVALLLVIASFRASEAAGLPLSGYVGIEETFDNNILEYSEEDISRLSQGQNQGSGNGKFSISLPHDFITSVNARLKYAFTPIAKNPGFIGIKAEYHYFPINTIKSYYWILIDGKQTFFRKNYLYLKALYVPEYYLRNLSYRDLALAPATWSNYAEARLQKISGSAELGRKLSRKVTAALQYKHTSVVYNRELTERDNWNNAGGATISIKPSSPYTTELGYQFLLSLARGRTMSDTLTDISYRSHSCNISQVFDLGSLCGIPIELQPGIGYEHQIYLSQKDPSQQPYGDTYHFGRRDDYLKASASARWHVSKHFEIHADYHFSQNWTNVRPEVNAFSAQYARIGTQFMF